MQYYNNTNFLYHHGVLGMKWGVRRYQNYDGTYTKRGLERYRKAESAYESAKQRLKDSKRNRDKVGVRVAKADKRSSKKEMSKAYERLSVNKRADQGKILYEKGKTISGNKRNNVLAQIGIIAAGKLVGSAVAKTGASIATKYGDIPVSALSQNAITIGGTIINVGIATKTEYENKRLRAYYAH